MRERATRVRRQHHDPFAQWCE